MTLRVHSGYRHELQICRPSLRRLIAEHWLRMARDFALFVAMVGGFSAFLWSVG